MKQYTVFSIDQVEGTIWTTSERKKTARSTPSSSTLTLRRSIKATEADIRYRGDRAFYNRGGDYIQMPPKHKFPKET